MRRFLPVLLFFLALLVSCDFKYEAPRPPTWGDQCQPSDPYYLELAQGTQFLSKKGEVSSDPKEALDSALEYIEGKGVDLEYKADGIEAWSRFNTTFPKTIYLVKDFESRPLRNRAEVLWHEVVHLRQYEKMTPSTFYQHYVFAEGRWALEVQAYRESFRVMRILGYDEAAIQTLMRSRAESLYDGYELVQMPRECAVGAAIEIWNADRR